MNVLQDIKSLIINYNTLVGVILGWILSSLTNWFYERRRMATLKFDSDLFIEKFQKSVRVSLDVVYKSGKLPVSNCIGYLTIIVNGKEEIPANLIVKKSREPCEIGKIRNGLYSGVDDLLCYECRGTGYLANSLNPRVFYDALCWSLPISSGRGLGNLEYAYLTHIPVKGRVRLRLFDIYNVKFENNEFYLIKVHSEYGVKYYPRICLKLPRNPKNTVNIDFKVVATGENVKKQAETTIKLEWDNEKSDYVLFVEKSPNDKKYFKNLFQGVDIYKLFMGSLPVELD